MIKYVACGGWAKSRSDGDEHYISPRKLIHLYGVPAAECIKLADMNTRKYLVGYPHGSLERLIWLMPRQDGEYQENSPLLTGSS